MSHQVLSVFPLKCHSKHRAHRPAAAAAAAGRWFGPLGQTPKVSLLLRLVSASNRLTPRGHRTRCSPRSARRWRASDLYNVLLVVAGVPSWAKTFFLSVSFLLTAVFAPRRLAHIIPTLSHQTSTHWAPVACMSPNTPSSQYSYNNKKTNRLTPTKHLFATFCFIQSQSFSPSLSLCLFLTLTSINADSCWTEAGYCTEENNRSCSDCEHVSQVEYGNFHTHTHPNSPLDLHQKRREG